MAEEKRPTDASDHTIAADDLRFQLEKPPANLREAVLLPSVTERWSPARLIVATMITQWWVDVIVAGVIMLNLGLTIVEADQTASGAEPFPAVEIFNGLLLVVYCMEVGVRGFACQEFFLKDIWNVTDSFVICADLLMVFYALAAGGKKVTNFVVLRGLRIARCLRIVKLLVLFPEVRVFVQGMVWASRAIFWGVLLILGMLTLWSILAVQLIHPLNETIAKETDAYDGCPRCGFAWSSVAMSMATIFQTIVAGDSWGLVALPILEHYPLTILFFVPCFVSISLIILNLILAVIVDSAMAQRELTLAEQADEKTKEEANAVKSFSALCSQLDTDKSGVISRLELFNGYDSNTEFKAVVQLIGLRREDLNVIFDIMDEDASGDVRYMEFAETLHRMRATNMQVLFLEICHSRAKIGEMTRVERKRQSTMTAGDQSFQVGNAEGGTVSKAASFHSEPLHEDHSASARLMELSNDTMTAVLDVGRRVQAQEHILEAHSRILADIGEALPVLLGRGTGPKRHLSSSKLGEASPKLGDVPSQWRAGTPLVAVRKDEVPCCWQPGGYGNPLQPPSDPNGRGLQYLGANGEGLPEREEKAGSPAVSTEVGVGRPPSWPTPSRPPPVPQLPG